MSLSQGAVSDWKEGQTSSLDIKSIIDNKLRLSYKKVNTAFNFHIAFGIQRQSLSDTLPSFIIPTDNELFSEAIISYPINWKVDPYFSINIRTQITESFRLSGINYIRTAELWDPVISQQALGFTYSKSGIIGDWSVRMGLAMKQIRAKNYTSLTDNPKTPKIKERYKTDAGIEAIQEINLNIDSSSYYKGRFAVYRILSTDLNKWSLQWENEINHIFWKYVGVILRFQLIYDDVQSKKVQFKESFSIGFVHNF